MADIKIVEIAVNKEIAKQAYEAGFGFAMADGGNILTVEGFEDWWSEFQIALAERLYEKSGLNLACVTTRCSDCLYIKYKPEVKHEHEKRICQITGLSISNEFNELDCIHFKRNGW